MKGTIIFKAFLILLSLFTFVLSLDAATTTWTGAGADNLASNPTNWLGNTANPYGSQTTVYFECGTGSSYDFSTTPQSIGDGTSDINVTADISNLLPSTPYHCRVVVTNAGGTIYGSDTSFSTPPITLIIISPISGSSVDRPDIMVRGTVTNAAGNETGVTVNGMIAAIYNNEFHINHVPLEDGSNIITVNAVDTAGNTSAVSKLVNAVITAPHVTLKANIESGSLPINSYFLVSTNIPNNVANYQIDFEGDGIFDYSDSVLNNISHTYTVEGVYYPTLSITDDQDIIYTDAIAVVVLPLIETDTLLKTKWNNMKALLVG